MKRVLVVALLFSALGLAYWYFDADEEASAPTEFATRTASRGDILTSINAIGVIKPKTGAEVRVGSRLSGVVTRLLVDIGDRVKVGQLLAELDDAALLGQIKEVQATIQLAKVELEFSRQQLQVAQSNSFTTKFELDSLTRTAAVNEARFNQASANLEAIQIQHAYSRITAPIAGTISSVSTQQGETVAASFSAPTFLTIVDLDRLEIQAYVDEADIGKVNLDQTVSFTVDTYPGVLFLGRVDGIYPSATIINNVVNYIVIIEIKDDREHLLRPEMTAHLQFETAKRTAVLTVPRMALIQENGETSVLISRAGQLQKQLVQIGMIGTSHVEIVQGLSEGDSYVPNSQQWLADQNNL